MTRPRSIRIDDDTWARAKAIASEQETSVTAMIDGFLKKLRPSKEAMATARAEAKKLNPKNPNQSEPPPYRFRPGTEGRPTKAECEHKVKKTIKFGTFCCQCGGKLS